MSASQRFHSIWHEPRWPQDVVGMGRPYCIRTPSPPGNQGPSSGHLLGGPTTEKSRANRGKGAGQSMAPHSRGLTQGTPVTTCEVFCSRRSPLETQSPQWVIHGPPLSRTCWKHPSPAGEQCPQHVLSPVAVSGPLCELCPRRAEEALGVLPRPCAAAPAQVGTQNTCLVSLPSVLRLAQESEPYH